MTDEEREKLWAISEAAYVLMKAAAYLPHNQSTPADLESAWQRLLALRWQGMGSAPKDGRHFLVLRKDGLQVVARRFNPSSRTDVIFSIPGTYEQKATAWMPLPPARKEAP